MLGRSLRHVSPIGVGPGRSSCGNEMRSSESTSREIRPTAGSALPISNRAHGRFKSRRVAICMPDNPNDAWNVNARDGTSLPSIQQENPMKLISTAVATIAALSCLVGVVAAAPVSSDGPANVAKPEGSYQVAQACGWYAIFACARNRGVTGPGRTIYTSDYPNFRPGYYCKVMGPFSRGEAVSRANAYGGYAKSAC
jgi:hypothetical protein